ncbi:MAG: hypothetical protein ACLVJ7_04800 [Acutalibacteraceae bacterium]|jgi:hypothetical protein
MDYFVEHSPFENRTKEKRYCACLLMLPTTDEAHALHWFEGRSALAKKQFFSKN